MGLYWSVASLALLAWLVLLVVLAGLALEGRPVRGAEDGGQLVAFQEQLFRARLGRQGGAVNEEKPEFAFVSFFPDGADLRNELPSRACNARGSMVGGHRARSANQLLPDVARLGRAEHRPGKLICSQGKLKCSFL